MSQRLIPPGTRPRFPFGTIVMTAEAFKRLSINKVSVALVLENTDGFNDEFRAATAHLDTVPE